MGVGMKHQGVVEAHCCERQRTRGIDEENSEEPIARREHPNVKQSQEIYPVAKIVEEIVLPFLSELQPPESDQVEDLAGE